MPGRELDPFVKRMFRSGDLVNRWVVLLSVVGGVFYFVRKHEPGGWQRDTAFGALLVLIVLYFAAVTVAFDTPQDRFRLPVDPMLLMFGVYGARELLALARKQIALRRLGLGRTALDPTQDSPPTQR